MEIPYVVTSFYEAVTIFGELCVKYSLTDEGYAHEDHWMASAKANGKILRCYKKEILTDMPMSVEIINSLLS